MTDTLWDAFRNLVVAVGLDDHAEGLVKAGVRLAERTGKTLHLVHVVEPWHTRLPGRILEPHSALWDATRAVERDTAALARDRLRAVAKRLAPDLAVHTHVAVGKPHEQLAKLAVDLDAALLVVGAELGERLPLPKGLSTALSLMESSPVPLLVVDARRGDVVPDHPLKLLVADDLADETEDAVTFAASLAAAMRGAWIHHVHVNPLSRELLQESLRNAAAAARAPLDAPFTVTDVYDSFLAAQTRRLVARADSQRPYVEASGGTYTWEVATGGIRPELSETVKAMHPDVLVFGRHRAVHQKPFFFGRMPVRAMLEHGIAVLIVPERAP